MTGLKLVLIQLGLTIRDEELCFGRSKFAFSALRRYTLKPDCTGCRHSYIEGTSCKIGGMSAAKCFTCDRLIARSIETAGTPATFWIVEKESGHSSDVGIGRWS
jgi:hypothetical protein